MRRCFPRSWPKSWAWSPRASSCARAIPTGRRCAVTAPSGRARRSLRAVRSLRAAEEVIEKGKAIAAGRLEVAAADLEFAQGHYRVRGTDVSLSFDAMLKDCESRSAGHGRHSTRAARVHQRGACRRSRDRPRHRSYRPCVVRCGGRHRPSDQPGARARTDSRRCCAGRGPGARRMLRLRRERPTAHRELHGLLHAAGRVAAVLSLELCRSTASPTNALGAKGAGETGSTGGLAAIANAVVDALRRSGVREFEMPATAHRVWQALSRERM